MIPKLPLNEIPPFQAAKWVRIPLLLSTSEMEALLQILPKWIVPLSGVIEEEKQVISQKEFLAFYDAYVQQLDAGVKRPAIDRRLTCAFSNDLGNFRASPVSNGVLIRVIRPVLQVQPYMIHYSEPLKKFIDTTHTQDSFAFGLAFSTPQLFQNPETKDIEKKIDPIFKSLQKWSREMTIPTPFLVDGKIINFSSRIGKSRKTPVCLPPK